MKAAFYLKYRPQKVAELDLVEVRERLLQLAKSGKIPHALLFVGPRGTGKTSAARIIAKVINCESKRKGSFEPCNRCSACKEITAGTALDLIEIDAASTRGIDDIRNLREKVKLAPTQLKNKVYIIDEVHMLTTEAFNALLKTLEEPPANTVFVLCTTAPEKLPETIVSRCTRFNFRKGNLEEVIGSLKRVVKGENLKISQAALEEIAKSVDGSFRDGQKILDQLASAGKSISLKATQELLGKIESLSPNKLLSLLGEKKVKEALLEIDRIVKSGGDLAVFTQELLAKLRFGLLSQVGLNQTEAAESASVFDLEALQTLISLFSQAAKEIKTNPIPQLPLELAVVKWCHQEEPEDEVDQPQVNQPQGNPSPGKKKNLDEVEGCWQEILTQIRPLNHSVEALLKASKPMAMKGEVLTLEVFYQFHKERLEEEKCRRIFEEVASQVLETPIKLKCVLGEKKPVIKSPPVETGKTAADDDIIKAAEEIFGTNPN